MKGKVSQWNDEKGFGFIKPDNGSEKIFFHVSSINTNARRPQIGDTVLFETTRDAQQRLKAKGVVIEGVPKSKTIKIEPPKKEFVDYIAVIILIFSLVAVGFEFLQTRVLEKFLLYGVPAVVAILFLNRQKKPDEKSFSCSGCRKTTDYDERTIEAWNRGVTKLYCKICHLEWLKNNPNQELIVQKRRGGCLGTLVLMVFIPVTGCIWLYNWLA